MSEFNLASPARLVLGPGGEDQIGADQQAAWEYLTGSQPEYQNPSATMSLELDTVMYPTDSTQSIP